MFKVGDRVKTAGGGYVGLEHAGVITRVKANGYDIACKQIDGEDSEELYYSKDEVLGLVNAKRGRPRIKPKPVKFLLKYDLDEDPIEEFSTMDEVRERIDYLVKNESSLKRDSMIVYEVRSKKTVTVETKIKLSK